MGGQVVTGIGFLGAGLIIRDGLNIRGLSTSATIRATGAIGVLAGYGEIFEAAEATLLILLINITSPRVIRLIERFVLQHPVESQRRRVEVRTTTESETEVRSSLMSQTRDDQLAVTSLARRVNSLDRNITIDVTISGDDVNDEVMSVLVQSLSLSSNILYCTFTQL
jgi:putative Mg2+ transporter-C (MgtC) family protein